MMDCLLHHFAHPKSRKTLCAAISWCFLHFLRVLIHRVFVGGLIFVLIVLGNTRARRTRFKKHDQERERGKEETKEETTSNLIALDMQNTGMDLHPPNRASAT